MRYAKFLALIPALVLCAAPTLSQAAFGISVSVNVAPPPLPVYVQPALPAPGYLWSPGYWAWDGNDYYWVPGTWVQPPSEGLLWTPGYWGWNDGLYAWNAGYWGPQVGFYGGVNYGYGYTGVGFEGGYWHGGAFFYNRSVANFGHVNIVNVYNTPVREVAVSRVSFNGGAGGLRVQPNAAERVAMNQRHIGATPLQIQHEQHAASMPALHRNENGGHPQMLTTARAGDFAHPGPGLHNHAAPHPGAGPAMQMHAAPEHRDEVNHAPGGGAPAIRPAGPEERHEGAPAGGGEAPRGGPPPREGGPPHEQAQKAPPREKEKPREEDRH